MPYKWEKLNIRPEDKKSRKLSDLEREQIKELYGKISQRKLAKMFNVSRRLITFIGCPEKHKENLKRRKESGGSMQYYDKEKNLETIKKHRRYKQELYLKGRLVEKSGRD